MRFAIAALVGLVLQSSTPPPVLMATGRVLDERTRAPLAYAKVTLIPSADQRRATPFIRPASVLTDADGRFVLTGLGPGQHTVQVTAAGYIGRGAGVTATATAEASTREIEVLLKPGGIVHGQVLDADGAPVEGALVFAQRRVEQGRVGTPVIDGLAPGVPGPRFVSIGGPAQTNAKGEFTTEAVEPGPYYLRATAPSLQGRETSPGSGITTKALPTYLPGTTEPVAALPITARAGEPTDVGEIRLQFASAFSVGGVVVDETGQPVEGVRVRLVPADAPRGALPMTGSAAHSAAGGEFRLTGVLPGRYLLVAVPPVVVERDGSPEARGRHGESFVLGGSRPETARGSVTTETADGTTREFRDELGTTMLVEIRDSSVFDVRIAVLRR